MKLIFGYQNIKFYIYFFRYFNAAFLPLVSHS